MFFDRSEAGDFLSARLAKFRKKPNILVLALPRGGVPVADSIAAFLEAPLDLIITRKIGHPCSNEYALGAISEYGSCILGAESSEIDPGWIEEEIEKETHEIERRKKTYLRGQKRADMKGKIIILVDDGVATGMTIKAALNDIQIRSPKEIIVAVPVIPKSSQEEILKIGARVIALETPRDEHFLGAVGAYYQNFIQISDRTVTSLLKKHQRRK